MRRACRGDALNLCRSWYDRFLRNRAELLGQTDDLFAEVQQKMDASQLPDKVDQQWVDSVVLEAYDITLSRSDADAVRT